ncbi:CpsD/CapB family tyrosine-protein kinase [Alkalihalobacillus sp. CinArs1]|uniref:CpsD/CapB family tyrosine-protein kinase n=1 Tax=Alkalihalobacillus sp. CinArs1 TaxID=2995314 RepID=UPI0022DDE043|nr:CpsD/CapB family tyrosine-protein kinase [Alkalihalobacillus sp. CinArs1]
MGHKEHESVLISRTLGRVAYQSKHLPISEGFRTLRTNIQFSTGRKQVKTLVITSSQSGDGKTTTSSNLAIVMAQQGKKVLLIDADMRKPSLHSIYHLPNRKGLSTVLSGQQQLEDMIIPTDIPRLDLLTSGPVPPNPSELLGFEEMEVLINQARDLYDFVIIDTPPLLVVSDAQILLNLCEMSLLVLKSGKTTKVDAKKAIHLMEKAEAKFLGVSLNQNKEKKMKDAYYYNEEKTR